MQPCAKKRTVSVKDIIQTDNIIDLSSSSSDCCTNDENTLSCADSQKQLVLYVDGGDEIETVPDRVSYKDQSLPRVLPSIGAFTVQCANCFKWRLVPSLEKYQEIRGKITEKPFVCETAHEWGSDVSCDDPTDIEQDGSRLWAIDRPNIAQPPPGWQRLLRIRGEGSSKFADIYYTAPTGKVLRSVPDVEKYLFKHPEYMEQGVTLSQFSFQTPKPSQENYVRKRRPAHLPDKPMALLGPDQNTDLQVGRCVFEPVYPPVKKRRSAPGKRIHNFDLMFRHHNM